MYLQRAAKLADLRFTVSRHAAAAIRSRQVDYVGFYIDTHFWDPLKVRPDEVAAWRSLINGRGGAEHVFVYPARFIRRKGQELLIRASYDLRQRLNGTAVAPKVKVILVGETNRLHHEYFGELMELVESLSLTDCVWLLDAQTPEKLRALLAIADAVVYPAINEGAGRSHLEGVLLGACAIVADDGGLTEYIQDGRSGLTFSPESTAELATQMHRVISCPDLRRELANAGRASASRLTLERFAADHIDLYQSLLQGRASRGLRGLSGSDSVAQFSGRSKLRSGDFIESAFLRSVGRIKEAYHGNSLPLAIQRQEFPLEPGLASIVAAAPTSEGGKLLRDAMIIDSAIEAAVRSRGVPDAVEMNRSHAGRRRRWFVLYYKQPPATVVYGYAVGDRNRVGSRYSGQLVFEMADVPRSVLRFALGQGPLSGPWPVTIPDSARDAFGVPPLGLPPPPQVGEQSWPPLAGLLASQMPAEFPDCVRRTGEVIGKLAQANAAPGLEWKAVLFDSMIVSGFSMPDGTLFVSSSLIEELNDGELAAVMAHLMGHARYQHLPRNLRMRREIADLDQREALPDLPRYPEVLTLTEHGFTRLQEVEANRIAVSYLAKIGISPDTLFDAFHKQSPANREAVTDGWPAFSVIHRLPEAALDLGKLLDAGLLESP